MRRFVTVGIVATGVFFTLVASAYGATGVPAVDYGRTVDGVEFVRGCVSCESSPTVVNVERFTGYAGSGPVLAGSSYATSTIVADASGDRVVSGLEVSFYCEASVEDSGSVQLVRVGIIEGGAIRHYSYVLGRASRVTTAAPLSVVGTVAVDSTNNVYVKAMPPELLKLSLYVALFCLSFLVGAAMWWAVEAHYAE